MALRSKPLYRVGHRPNHFLGGDREVVLFFGVLGGALLIQGGSLAAKLIGLGLWLFGLRWARDMVKRDPLWRQIWQRRRLYRGVYRARSTSFRDNSPLQGQRYRR